MEYIEPKPIEGKARSRTSKIRLATIITLSTSIVLSAGSALLIKYVFSNYDNISHYRYSYSIYDESKEVTIQSVVSKNTLPSVLRIPEKLNGMTVTSIADGAFSYCTNLREIVFPNSIKSFGKSAFDHCTNLETFNVPSSLDYIGTGAFSSTKWFDSQANGEVLVGKLLYSYKGQLPEDSIIVASKESPEYSLHTGEKIDLSEYTYIADGVFKGQENLVYVEIPESVIELPADYFDGCSKLAKVVLPSTLRTIGNNVFNECYDLAEINFPEAITSIGENAFAYTSLVGSITLPKMLNNLGAGAFQYNRQLTGVTFPELRSNGGLVSIPEATFLGCSKLATVTFPEAEFVPDTAHISSISSNAFKGTAIESFVVPYNVESIGSSAFENCTELNTITFYNNLNGTIKNTFLEVDGEWKKSATSILQGVVSINTKAFNGCTSLSSFILKDEDNNVTPNDELNIPVTLSTLGPKSGEGAVFASTAFKTINFYKNLVNVNDTLKATYLELDYITPYFAQNVATLENLNIKQNLSLVRIHSNAFEGCTSLTKVELPPSMLEIEANAFLNCTSLSEINGEVSKDKAIAKSAFEGCSSLEAFTLNELVVQIHEGAFRNAVNLKEVTFLSDTNLTIISKEAFKGCSSLEEMNLPNSLSSLGNGAFENCASLKSVTFGTALSSIEANAFRNTALEEVSLPRGIKSLSAYLFGGCGSLTKLTLNYLGGNGETKEPVKFNTTALKDSGITETTGEIFVPAELVDIYKADEKWSAYSSIIKAIVE